MSASMQIRNSRIQYLSVHAAVFMESVSERTLRPTHNSVPETGDHVAGKEVTQMRY